MKNSNEELVLRTDRLTLFALHLFQIENSGQICLLEDFDHLYNESEISVFPTFKAVINCLPEVFPGEWVINKEEEIVWTEKPEQCTLTSIIHFFQIDRSLFIHMLVPHGQLPEHFGGEEIDKKSSLKTLGQNILEAIFCLCYLPLLQTSSMLSKN